MEKLKIKTEDSEYCQDNDNNEIGKKNESEPVLESQPEKLVETTAKAPAKVVEKKKSLSQYEIERYAVMCNAHLEHQDEMEQYKND